jgi:hypothetical protein
MFAQRCRLTPFKRLAPASARAGGPEEWAFTPGMRGTAVISPPYRSGYRQVGVPDRSSSSVTATAAFADRRTVCPSTSATSPRSMK